MPNLSRDYALWHALHQDPVEILRGLKAVVVEVDVDKLDKTLLRPDEDFLKQYRQILRWLADPESFISDSEDRKPMTEGRRKYLQKIVDPSFNNLEAISDDIEEHADRWEISLKKFGCVAYKETIPVGAITRYAEIKIPMVPLLKTYVQNMTLAVSYHPIQRYRTEALLNLVINGEPLTPVPADEYISEADVRSNLRSFGRRPKLPLKSTRNDVKA